MKKFVFLLSLLCILCHVSVAQSFFNSLEVNIAGAYQQYDDRLFEFSGTVNPSSGKGNYQYAFILNTNFYTYKSWAFHLGVGYTKEINTFRRPFDHCFFTGTPCTYILLRMDRYENDLLLFPLDISYDLIPFEKFGISFNLQFLPSINFFKYLKSGERVPYEKSVFDFYALEFNPGIGFMFFDRVSVNLNYRVFQLKNVDEVIIYPTLFDDYNAPDGFETYNPRKIWLSLRYEIFRFNKDREEKR